MRDVLVVLQDLWKFCFATEDTSVVIAVTSTDSSSSNVVSPSLQKVDLHTSQESPALTSVPASYSAAGIVPYQTGALAYVSVQSAECFVRAVQSYDGVVGRLPYGQAVSVGQASGRFCLITTGEVSGWILKDSCTFSRTDIFPIFHVGTSYYSSARVTQAIRMFLQDEFAAAPLLLPLQPEEYVTYRIKEASFTIPWGPARPRLAGEWHTLLRGRARVHVGVEARTHSLLEWNDADGNGRLAYVESVSPDEEIVISYILGTGDGLYCSHVVSANVWREWRPVWITIS